MIPRLRAVQAHLAPSRATPVAEATSERCDVLIRGGTIIDGSGAAPFDADIAIVGDTIRRIGPNLNMAAAKTIDATGHIVTPGFVDVHTHVSRSPSQPPAAPCSVRAAPCSLLPAPAGAPAHVCRGLTRTAPLQYDGQVTWDPYCSPSTYHGVTTVAFGNWCASTSCVQRSFP